MFKLEYSTFKNPQVAMSALRKIYTFEGYDSLKKTKKVSGKIKAIEHHFSAYTQELQSIAAITDADEKKEAMEALHAKSFDLETKKFEKKELMQIKFSPAEIEVIEKLANADVFH